MNESNRFPTIVRRSASARHDAHVDIQDVDQLSALGHALGVGVDVIREAVKAFGRSPRQLQRLSSAFGPTQSRNLSNL